MLFDRKCTFTFLIFHYYEVTYESLYLIFLKIHFEKIYNREHRTLPTNTLSSSKCHTATALIGLMRIPSQVTVRMTRPVTGQV